MVVTGVLGVVVTGVMGFDTAGEAIDAGIATGRGVGVAGVPGVVVIVVDKDGFELPKRLAARIY